jgi:MHS family proline/betaine transporter-like MFS transporter
MKKPRYFSIELFSAWLGNLFEHYDTALFGCLSPFLAPLIFPNNDPITALILTYALIPLGMLARPIGSLFFGYIGDVYGRKQALFLSLAGMSIVSAGIAFSPTYAQAGILAPLIFCIGRMMQNFLASGETMGGAIYLLENTPQKRHDLLSGIYGASMIGGILLASAGVCVLSYFHVMHPGWRALYLFGCITGVFGCVLRRQLPQSTTVKSESSLSTLLKGLWTYRRPLLLIAISAGFSYANYTIALVLMNGFIPLVTPFTKVQMMSLNTALLVFDFCALPLFGYIASKFSREKMMLATSLSVAVCAIPLFTLLNEPTLLKVIAFRLCFVLFGVAFCAPMHAWAQELVPTAHRYAVLSFAYALGSQILGGPTAAVSLWFFKHTGMASSVAWYWVALAAASSLAIAAALKSRRGVPTI